jgi:hypothetical protein
MSVTYYIEKIKESERDIYLALVILLIGLLGFGLGRLSKLEERKTPVVIKNEANLDSSLILEDKKTVSSGQYVASKTGSSYYFPWCSGVKRIRESNKVWFSTKEDAILAGYAPAGNCKGL